jgi:hypothetical protein
MTRRGGAARCSYVGLGASSLHRFRTAKDPCFESSHALHPVRPCLLLSHGSWLVLITIELYVASVLYSYSLGGSAFMVPTRLKYVSGSAVSLASAVRLFLQDCISPHTMHVGNIFSGCCFTEQRSMLQGSQECYRLHGAWRISPVCTSPLTGTTVNPLLA